MKLSKSKLQHPPLCPRSPKAQHFVMENVSPSQLLNPNKNQRHSHNLHSSGSSRFLSPKGQPPIPRPRGTAPVMCGSTKQEIRQRQYRQYSRKAYLRRGKGKLQSDLTDKVIARNISEDSINKIKSQSALSYAKYFIKQVSNTPTNHSSKEQTPNQNEEAPLVNNQPLPSENSNIDEMPSERELSRNRSRRKIVDKLRSLKSFRSNSKSQQKSMDKQGASVQKRTERGSTSRRGEKRSSSKQGSSENMIARLKARYRNKQVVLKVRMQNYDGPLQESMSLMLNSLIDRTHSEKAQTADKIELHLELLNILPTYVKQFKEIYEDVQCWDELVFLTYKKFYIERVKVLKALQQMPRVFSPFCLPFCHVSAIQLRNFNPSLQGLKMEEKVREQNKKIECALRELYNHIIEKSGRFINMYEQDNFSEELYLLMSEEVRLLGEDQAELNTIRKNRMALTIKCCFLIASLNGQEVDVEDILTENEWKRKNVKKFQQLIRSLQ